MNIFEKLQALQSRAYAPYSHFHVAAILILDDGTEVPGVNVENAAYGATICAERSAFVGAVSHFGAGAGFKEIHLLAGSNQGYASPCGDCRQVMLELAGTDLQVHLYNRNGDVQTHTTGELLPNHFVTDG